MFISLTKIFPCMSLITYLTIGFFWTRSSSFVRRFVITCSSTGDNFVSPSYVLLPLVCWAQCLWHTTLLCSCRQIHFLWNNFVVLTNSTKIKVEKETGTLRLENACFFKAPWPRDFLTRQDFHFPYSVFRWVRLRKSNRPGDFDGKNIFYSSFSNCFCGDGPGCLSVLDELTSAQKRCPR